MDGIIDFLINLSFPLNDSLKNTDFSNSVLSTQNKILEFFRFGSLEYLSTFFSQILDSLEENAKSNDKRKKYSSAVCICAIINIFPFDNNVIEYRNVIDKLLQPGYKPLVIIGTICLGRLAKIYGPNRDLVLREYIEIAQKGFIQNSNIDLRFLYASLLHELTKSAPELIFEIGSGISMLFTNSLQSNDRVINRIILDMIGDLFESESASIATDFLFDLHYILLLSATSNLKAIRKQEGILSNLELIEIILNHNPVISHDMIKGSILPECISFLKSDQIEVSIATIRVICFIAKRSHYQIEKDLIKKCFSILIHFIYKSVSSVESTFMLFIDSFHQHIEENLEDILYQIDLAVDSYPNEIPYVVFRIYVYMVKYISQGFEILPILNRTLKIINRYSVFSVPVYSLLKFLNLYRKNWSSIYKMFKYEVLQVIRRSITNQQINTNRIVDSLKTLCNIPDISYNDAMEFNSLVMKLRKSKDIDVREMICQTIIHLFYNYPNQIPIKTIHKIVKFALNDPSRSVRIQTLKAFGKYTYIYLSQSDIFSEFYRFINDESIEVRKEAFYIIRNLPIFSTYFVRNELINSIKQINMKYGIVSPETSIIWECLPNLIQASNGFIEIYAPSLVNILLSILNKRFIDSQYKEIMQQYLNNALLLKMDESVIKSITRLSIMCSQFVPISTVLELFSNLLMNCYHPWTKEQLLKSLKNLIIALPNQNYRILEIGLIHTIKDHQSPKLITKALKVLGSIGTSYVQKKEKKSPMIFKSSLKNLDSLRSHYLLTFFNYLQTQLMKVGVENTRESIMKCTSSLFRNAPEIIPMFLQPFLDTYLNFLQKSNCERLSQFINYLTEIIASSGHIISPYSEKIFQSIEEYWHDKYTKECCYTLSSLVIATKGQCDSVLNLIITVSFILAKTHIECEKISVYIFYLLRVIAQYNNSFLPSVINGLSEILSNPSSAGYLQEHSLDTCEFIVFECNSYSHLISVKRCLYLVSQRNQQRWKDRSNEIIAKMDKSDLNTYHPILPTFLSPLPSIPFEASTFIEHMKLPKSNLSILSQEIILNWFLGFREHLLENSPSSVIRIMSYLPQVPKFGFRFGFLILWMNCAKQEQEKLIKLLSKILKLKNLPFYVLSQVIDLLEFCCLSEIGIEYDREDLIEKCIANRLFYKALFFLEANLSFKEDQNIESNDLEKLIRLNEIINRRIESKCFADLNVNCVNNLLWMEIGNWTKCYQILQSNPNLFDFCSKVRIYGALDDWKSIYQCKAEFYQQKPNYQSQLVKYFSMAEMYCGNEKECHELWEHSGANTVEDSIARIVQLCHYGKIDEAQELVHKGWRFLSASTGSIERHNINLIQKNLYQAESLHKLGVIIENYKIGEEKIPFSWIPPKDHYDNQSFKQTELFRILSLLPHNDESRENAFSILSSLAKSTRNWNINYQIDILFPDHDSLDSKFLHLRQLHIYQRLESLPNFLNTNDPLVNRKAMNLYGKDLFRSSKSLRDLNQAYEFLYRANQNKKKLIDIQCLICYISRDSTIFVKAVPGIIDIILNDSITSLLYLQVLFSLVLLFSDNETVLSEVTEQINDIAPTFYAQCFSLILSLVYHPKNSIKSFAKRLVLSLSQKIPQILMFDIITQKMHNPTNQDFQHFSDFIQEKHPVVFSQMSILSEKFTAIINNVYDSMIYDLLRIKDSFEKGILNEINSNLSHLIALFEMKFESRYESEFLKTFPKDMVISLKEFSKNIVINDESYSMIMDVLDYVVLQQDSIRVIPLSSLDNSLSKKQNWVLSVFGKELQNDLRINKIHHSFQRWKNGFRFSFIGNDGIKYGFHLKKWDNLKNQQAELFMRIINDITPVIDNYQRYSIQVSPSVVLRELLKGHLSVFDLISNYKQTLGENVDHKLMKQSQKYDKLDYQNRNNLINHYTKGPKRYDLAKAILVTSKNSSSWLKRSSMFSKSYGALSALGYLIGSPGTGSTDILFEKTTGSTTYTSFRCSGSTQEMPFRMTRMIISALGITGAKGPFKETFELSLRQVHKHRNALASVIQFAIGQPPFEQCLLPTQYLAKYSFQAESSSHIDALYSRMIGENNKIQDEISFLVDKASAIDQLSKMPSSWIPWW